jgi:hypothetical protein
VPKSTTQLQTQKSNIKVEFHLNKYMKKAVKLATVTTMAATAIAAINPTQSEAASSALDLVLKAEATKIPMIRATSVDYNADTTVQPWKEYNQAKADYAAAKAAVAKLSGKEKEQLNARLDIVKLWIDRTAGYIDSISSGKKLLALQEEMDKHLADGKMEEATAAYHKLSYEIKKQAKILYRVYGQSTRAAILETYKAPAEESKNAALYPVSIHVELGRLDVAFQKADNAQIEKNLTNIEAWLEKVEEGKVFDALVQKYEDTLNAYAPEVAEVALVDGVEYPSGLAFISGFDTFAFLDEEGNELNINPAEYGFIVKDDKGYFNEDGSLKEAFAKTGLTELGKVKVQLIDGETKEVLLEKEINIIDGNQVAVLSAGKMVDSEGKDSAYAVTGQTYQFAPTETTALNGTVVKNSEATPITLAQFEGATFKSSDVTVFVVNADGKITSVTPGKAELTISWNGEDLILPIEVKSASAVVDFGLAEGKDKIYVNGNTNFDALIDAGYFTAKDQYGQEADLKKATTELFTSREAVFTVNNEEITLTGADASTASLVVKINGVAKTFPIVIDKTAPVVKGITNEALTNQDVKLTTDATDVASVTAKRNGNAVVDYTLATALTEDGLYEVIVTDKAGNNQKVTFEIDKKAPTLAISGTATNPVITASEAVYYKNTTGDLVAITSATLDEATANALFTYTGTGVLKSVVVDAEQKTWSFTTENSAAADTVTYKDAVLFDQAGNQLGQSVKASFDGTAWTLVTE